MAGEFSYDRYADLVDAAVDGGYEFLTVREYLRREDHPERFVILRHDVDRKPENALDLARIEADAGVDATYYFRAAEATYEPEIFEAVEALGHEVGYHYEDLDRTDGDVAAAHEAFAANLSRFREHVTVDTVSMHGNPLTPHDNREMWTGGGERDDGVEGDRADDHPTFTDYDLLGEVYLSVDFTDVTYFTDTNRTWYDEKTVVDDWPVGANGKSVQVQTTSDLIDLVTAGDLDRLYLLAHPDRWTDSATERAFEVAKDAVFNAGKLGLWHLRRLRGDAQSGASEATMASRAGESGMETTGPRETTETTEPAETGRPGREASQPTEAESGAGG